MKFNNKFKVIIFFVIVLTSTYIGYLLGTTFCLVSEDSSCTIDLIYYIAVSNIIGVVGIYTLVNLAEKSITEWNYSTEEE